MSRLPIALSYWPLLLLWVPLSFATALAVGWAFHIRDDFEDDR